MTDYSGYTDEHLDRDYAIYEQRAMKYHAEMMEIANEKMRRIRAKMPDTMVPAAAFSLEELELARSMMEKTK